MSRRKFPKVLPVEWMRDGQAGRTLFGADPAKGDDYKPTTDYHPTAIIVACTRCHTVATVDFPRGFDAKVGDRLMDGRIVNAFCPSCHAIVEVRPITPKELRDNALDLLKRYHEIAKDLAIVHEGQIVPMEEIVRKVMEDTAAFMGNGQAAPAPLILGPNGVAISPEEARKREEDDRWENRKPTIVVP